MSLQAESSFQMIRVLGLQHETTWMGAIVANDSDRQESLEELKAEVEAQLDLQFIPIDVSSGDKWERLRAVEPRRACICLYGFETWGSSDWQSLDSNRSALEMNCPLILLLTPGSAEQLSRYAPNIRSYLGSLRSLRATNLDLTDEERAQRLRSLREKHLLSDAEIIEQAEQGSLMLGPDFVEWLVLLNRGDLI